MQSYRDFCKQARAHTLTERGAKAEDYDEYDPEYWGQTPIMSDTGELYVDFDKGAYVDAVLREFDKLYPDWSEGREKERIKAEQEADEWGTWEPPYKNEMDLLNYDPVDAYNRYKEWGGYDDTSGKQEPWYKIPPRLRQARWGTITGPYAEMTDTKWYGDWDEDYDKNKAAVDRHLAQGIKDPEELYNFFWDRSANYNDEYTEFPLKKYWKGTEDEWQKAWQDWLKTNFYDKITPEGKARESWVQFGKENPQGKTNPDATNKYQEEGVLDNGRRYFIATDNLEAARRGQEAVRNSTPVGKRNTEGSPWKNMTPTRTTDAFGRKLTPGSSSSSTPTVNQNAPIQTTQGIQKMQSYEDFKKQADYGYQGQQNWTVTRSPQGQVTSFNNAAGLQRQQRLQQNGSGQTTTTTQGTNIPAGQQQNWTVTRNGNNQVTSFSNPAGLQRQQRMQQIAQTRQGGNITPQQYQQMAAQRQYQMQQAAYQWHLRRMQQQQMASQQRMMPQQNYGQRPQMATPPPPQPQVQQFQHGSVTSTVGTDAQGRRTFSAHN